jgi:ABC-type nitrate/sulfonate/bicarbonate transport system substrate-binding protein
MLTCQRGRWLWSAVFLFLPYVIVLPLAAEEQIFIAHGAQNEMNGPLWMAVEKGSFKKYGLDVRMLQVRSGAVSIAALASGSLKIVWTHPSSALSAVSGGMKMSCIASSSNKITRELVVRRGIGSLEDLRGKVFGVQSIGGGFWLQTMTMLESLGIDPDKYQLALRVVGDTAVVAQALMSENIDAAVLPYSFAEQAKRAGFRSLADSADLKTPYQGNCICALRDAIANSPDLMTNLIKGMIEGIAMVQDPNYKQQVMDVLKKNLRLSKAEDVEASYKVLRLMTTMDVAPNPEAWRTIQKIVARVNGKVAQVDLDQVLNGSFVQRLEKTGFLTEARQRAVH